MSRICLWVSPVFDALQTIDFYKNKEEILRKKKEKYHAKKAQASMTQQSSPAGTDSTL